MSRLRIIAAVVCALALTAFATPAYADSLGILRQSNNASADLVDQLEVDLSFTSSGGTTTAHFRFGNDVGTTSSLTHIYFRDDLDTHLDFTTAAIMDSGTTVAFTASSVTPTDPPSGASAFGDDWNATYAIESIGGLRGTIENGVNTTTEWVQVDVDLVSTASEIDVFEAFRTYLAPSSQLALRIDNIGGSATTSDWYYGQIVPEPSTVALMALGLGGLLWIDRRRRVRIVPADSASLEGSAS